eukprot:m.55080 g.55080  ORF g.55080 m.55080 type:complete len:52 (-) comp13649_c0_seq31:3557-3712(-)
MKGVSYLMYSSGDQLDVTGVEHAFFMQPPQNPSRSTRSSLVFKYRSERSGR